MYKSIAKQVSKHYNNKAKIQAQNDSKQLEVANEVKAELAKKGLHVELQKAGCCYDILVFNKDRSGKGLVRVHWKGWDDQSVGHQTAYLPMTNTTDQKGWQPYKTIEELLELIKDNLFEFEKVAAYWRNRK